MVNMKPTLAVNAPLEAIQYPVYGSPKFDGIRCIQTSEGPRTRTLKPIPNVATHKLMLEDMSNMHLDGEIIAGNPTAHDAFRVTSSHIMSHAGKPAFRYYVFDIWNHSGTYEERYGLMQVWQDANLLPPYVELVKQTMLHDEEELLKYENEQLELGYEGVILRNPKSPYKHGRSTLREQYLLKRKPLNQAEGMVIDWEYLRVNTNEAVANDVGYAKRSTEASGLVVDYSRMGALVVEVLNGEYKGARVNIGTGFTMAEREHLASNSANGKIVTFAYQSSGAKDRPRFPSFKGFRDKIDI